MVFGAEEYGGRDVAAEEEKQTAVVDFVVMVGIEDRQEDETAGTADGEEDGDGGQGGLDAGGVGRETTVMAQPAFGHESEVKEGGRDCGAGDEKRLQTESTDI